MDCERTLLLLFVKSKEGTTVAQYHGDDSSYTMVIQKSNTPPSQNVECFSRRECSMAFGSCRRPIHRTTGNQGGTFGAKRSNSTLVLGAEARRLVCYQHQRKAV